MKTATELARELPAGPELNALFFETCCGWRKEMLRDPSTQDEPRWSGAWIDNERMPWTYCRAVSTDAAACEAWAMRWARENGFIWRIEQRGHRCRCEFWGTMKQRLPLPEYGDDWKHALVRACIAAAEQLNPKGAEHGN